MASGRWLVPLIGQLVCVTDDDDAPHVVRLVEIARGGPRVKYADGRIRPAAEWRISRHLPLTRRQRKALAWLERVGKAGPQSIRHAGFSVQTFHALTAAGAINREAVGVRSVPYFRAVL